MQYLSQRDKLYSDLFEARMAHAGSDLFRHCLFFLLAKQEKETIRSLVDAWRIDITKRLMDMVEETLIPEDGPLDRNDLRNIEKASISQIYAQFLEELDLEG